MVGVGIDVATTDVFATALICDTCCVNVTLLPLLVNVTVFPLRVMEWLCGTSGSVAVPVNTVGIASCIFKKAILPVSLVVNSPEPLTYT